ncbi:MAG TPA: hypothetical protein VMW64_06885 [Dehalococcoidia bacterium]|nr:hypothetical protein [Dehalococcoidia bacterium]
MNGDKRYHAEVKVTIEGHEARINCFDDTLNEIFLDIGTICSQFPPDWINPAMREAMNQANIARHEKARLAPKPKPGPKPEAESDELFGEETGEIPVCPSCGTNEAMELVKWTDKETGAPRAEWKCQNCHKWLPKKNGRGR